MSEAIFGKEMIMKKILSFIILTVISMSMFACSNTSLKNGNTKTTTETPHEEPPVETPKPEYISKLLPTAAEPAGEVGDLPSMTLTENDVLTVKDGLFYLEGKPFVEISFNKFDLFWQLITPLLQNDNAAFESMLIKQELYQTLMIFFTFCH